GGLSLKQTKISPPRTSTETGNRPCDFLSKSFGIARAAVRLPSMSYIQPWYGHSNLRVEPLCSRHTSDPRCRHTFAKALTLPSEPRTTIADSLASSNTKKSPGFGIWDTCPA